MVDYYSILLRAVTAPGAGDARWRRGIYDRSRQMLATRMRGLSRSRRSPRLPPRKPASKPPSSASNPNCRGRSTERSRSNLRQRSHPHGRRPQYRRQQDSLQHDSLRQENRQQENRQQENRQQDNRWKANSQHHGLQCRRASAAQRRRRPTIRSTTRSKRPSTPKTSRRCRPASWRPEWAGWP